MKRSVKKKRYSKKRNSMKRYSKRKSFKKKYSRKLNIKNKSKKKYSRKKRRNSKKVIVGGVSTVDDVESDGSYDELMGNFEQSVQLLQESEENLEIANDNNEALQNKNVELVKQIEEQEKKIIDCGASEQIYNQRETELQESEYRINELQNDLGRLQEDLESKELQLQESLANVSEGPIATTSCDKTEIQNELDLTRQQLEDNEKQREKLQAELDLQKEEVSTLTESKGSEEDAKFKAQNSERAMEIKLNEKNGELQKNKVELESKIEELTKATSNIEGQNKAIKNLTQQLGISKTKGTNDKFEKFKGDISKIINSPSVDFGEFDKLSKQFNVGADKLQADIEEVENEGGSLLDEIEEVENPK